MPCQFIMNGCPMLLYASSNYIIFINANYSSSNYIIFINANYSSSNYIIFINANYSRLMIIAMLFPLNMLWCHCEWDIIGLFQGSLIPFNSSMHS
jgi:hypothetical protein